MVLFGLFCRINHSKYVLKYSRNFNLTYTLFSLLYLPYLYSFIISFYTVDQLLLYTPIQYENQIAPTPPDQNNPDYPARTYLLYVLQSLLPT